MAMRRYPEDDICMALMQWWTLQHPGMKRSLTFSLGGNNLSRTAAGKSKAMGYHSGTPDYFLSVPIKHGDINAPGFYLEVKTPTGALSKDQQERINELRGWGYYCAVGYGLDECMELIKAYMAGRYEYRFTYDRKRERNEHLKLISSK
jgi:hypothetical protein